MKKFREREKSGMTVEVRNNDINKALRILKKRMQTEGLFNEMREKSLKLEKLMTKLSLEKNIDKLEDIENTLYENSQRNYKSFLILITVLISSINYYLYSINILEPFFFYISLFILFILFSMRPKRKSNVE